MTLSRRRLLGTAAAGLTLATLPVVARATGRDPRLVVILLRGALDGLAAVAPYGDPDYRAQRAGLALPEPGQPDGLLDLGGQFGLNPALAPLHPLYTRGDLAFVHAVASSYRGRSHFDAQNMLESGRAAPSASTDGWLARAVAALTGTAGGQRRLGLAIGQSVPLALRGAVPVASWAPAGQPKVDDDLMALVRGLYARDPLLGPVLDEGLRAHRMAAEALGTDATGGMGGGRGPAPQAFRILAASAGRLLLAADGPRLAVLDMGGWDTHSQQQARLAGPLATLAGGIAALAESLRPVWAETLIVVATEFGRTVRPNGSLGTDHGTGGCAILAGGRVAGGRVLGDWPGLADGRLFEGRDLAATTDLRQLFKAALVGHVGLAISTVEAQVFPDTRALQPPPGILRV